MFISTVSTSRNFPLVPAQHVEPCECSASAPGDGVHPSKLSRCSMMCGRHQQAPAFQAGIGGGGMSAIRCRFTSAHVRPVTEHAS